MSRYIIEQQKKPPECLAWISMILMTANVYHTQLMTVFGLYSPITTVVIQAGAVTCFLAYLLWGKGLKLGQVQLGLTETLMVLSLAVILLTTANWRGNLTYIIRYGVYVVMVLLFRYDEKLVKIAFRCLLAAGLLHILFTIWFQLDTPFYLKHIYPSFTPAQQEQLFGQMLYNGYSAGIAVHYSVNGMYMAITLCCTYTLLLTGRKKGAALLFFINLLALIMTGKRGAMVFAAFAMLWAYLLWGRQAFGNKLVRILFGVAVCGLAIYLFTFYSESAAAAFARWEETLFGGKIMDISSGRFRLYRIAWELFLKNPLTGIGWREFTSHMSGSAQLMDAHNVFLQLLCETGMIGCGVFVALFALVYGTTVKKVLRSRENPSNRGLLLFSICYQTFFLCYCMTGNPLYDQETLFAYVIAVSAAGVSGRQEAASKYFPEEEHGTNRIGNHTGL